MSEIVDPFTGTPIAPDFSAFLEISTPQGVATLRICEDTANQISADPNAPLILVQNPSLAEGENYWGNYYDRNERGRLHSDYVSELLECVADPHTNTNTNLGVFFDDQVAGGASNNNPFSHNADDCDCNCNCNCNCDSDCNCDCNCG